MLRRVFKVNEKTGHQKPIWLDPENIGKILDARPIIESGGHPLEQVMQDLASMENNKIYELITPFLPSPLLDVVKKKGYNIWSEEVEGTIVKNYFIKNNG